MQIALKELKVEIFRFSRSLYVATGITASIFQWGKQFRWRCCSVEFSLGKFLLSVTSSGFKSAAVYMFAVRLHAYRWWTDKQHSAKKMCNP